MRRNRAAGSGAVKGMRPPCGTGSVRGGRQAGQLHQRQESRRPFLFAGGAGEQRGDGLGALAVDDHRHPGVGMLVPSRAQGAGNREEQGEAKMKSEHMGVGFSSHPRPWARKPAQAHRTATAPPTTQAQMGPAPGGEEDGPSPEPL